MYLWNHFFQWTGVSPWIWGRKLHLTRMTLCLKKQGSWRRDNFFLSALHSFCIIIHSRDRWKVVQTDRHWCHNRPILIHFQCIACDLCCNIFCCFIMFYVTVTDSYVIFESHPLTLCLCVENLFVLQGYMGLAQLSALLFFSFAVSMCNYVWVTVYS